MPRISRPRRDACAAPSTLRDAGASRVVALERALGGRPEFSGIARYTQMLARPSMSTHARGGGGTR